MKVYEKRIHIPYWTINADRSISSLGMCSKGIHKQLCDAFGLDHYPKPFCSMQLGSSTTVVLEGDGSVYDASDICVMVFPHLT
jgi:hypothetical protein